MLKSIRTIRETECKWRIACVDDYDRFIEQARQLGAVVSGPRRVNIYDQYLDTEDRYFHLARASCRLRSMGDRWELTIKASRKADNNVFSRTEKTFLLPALQSASEALEYCQREILMPILKGRAATTLFCISNDREIRELTFAEGIRAESGLDVVEMQYLNRTVSSKELELELLAGDERDFCDLVTQLTQLVSLQPIDISKYDQAMAAFGLVKKAVNNPTYPFDRDASVAKAARAIVGRDLQMIRDSEPGVRVGIYHDAIHDMRVACRRIRTALRIFKPLLPKNARNLSKEVAWLGSVLGKGRDLEVQIVNLKKTAWLLSEHDRANLHRYWECLSQRFEHERGEIMQSLDSARYSHLLRALEEISLSTPKQGNQEMHAAKAGGRIIGQGLKRIFAKYPRKALQQEITDKSLHKLRIELKRIRYLGEFFSHVSSTGMVNYIEKTKVLQKILGDHQDFVTGDEMVRADSLHSDDPVFRDCLEKLAAKLAEGKAAHKKTFQQAWQNF